MTKLSPQQQKEYNRLIERIEHITRQVDNATDEGREIPLNLVFEARHNSLSRQIIEIQAKIDEILDRELYDADEVSRLETRRLMLISRAREIGKVNGYLADLSKYNKDVTITRM